jgi:copper oxidase (laccase) domain-containing protein|uniref:Laccase domain-containing protein n=1 Tax=candidate division WOR-3 bacterium TaxID=2052148 RepID=A0A7C4XUV0_UNCW3
MWKLIEEDGLKYFRLDFKNIVFLYSTRVGPELFLGRFKPIFLKQIHSSIIIDVDKEFSDTGDGLITSGDKPIGVKVADCLPVYLFNKDKIAILHCGWRSIAGGILGNVRKIMKDYQYVLGACIGPCCYEIKDDVASIFDKKFPGGLIKEKGRIFLDLKKTVFQELGADKIVADLNYCTCCNTDYFYSHRRGDKGRNYAVIFSLTFNQNRL